MSTAVQNVPDEFAFGLALNLLKAGVRVARRGWNGKGMWLALVHPASHEFKLGAEDLAVDFVWSLDARWERDGLRPLPWIGMKTADDCFVPWLASQTDLLAEDWQVVDG